MNSWPAFGAGMIVGLLLYMFPACGGGSSAPSTTPAPVPPPAPVAIADTVDHYLPPFFMRNAHGVVVTLADPATVYAEFTSSPGYDAWGDGKEIASVRVCNNQMYAYADGYGSLSNNIVYGIEAVIDRVTDVHGTIDLAQFCPGRPGSYLPWNLPATGEITVEQWFWILNANGSRNRPGYWKSRFVFGEIKLNPCWQGTGSNMRQVIKQFETWHDPAAGWVRGHPTPADALPWINGVPQEITTTAEQENDFGRDAGPLWRGRDASVELCLRTS